MKRSGVADLPLHSGRVPLWLAERMAKLGTAIAENVLHHYVQSALFSRLSDPFWFQALGAVMGMDWHSSGITTSVIGALKRGLNPRVRELGIYVSGGRGRHSQFRADLFHRLNVISLALPSLREHLEDVSSLAQHFSALYSRNCNRKVTGISNAALACLTQYNWPGNIRELENAMERAIVIGSTETILAEDLPETVLESMKGDGSTPTKYHDAIRDLKKHLILNALDQSQGNVTEAAQFLGVHANYLRRLVRNFQLRTVVKKQTSG